MLAILYGLLTGFCFASAALYTQKGLHDFPTPWGAWITLVVNSLFLWVFHLPLHPEAPILITDNLPFVVIGLFVPGISRLLAFRGIRNMGSSVTATVLNSTPLFSTTLAVAFLGERPGFLVVFGIGSIMGGLIVISWEGGKGKWSRIEILYPLLAAFLFGAKDVMARWGMAATGQPILAAAIATTTATVEVTLITRFLHGEKFILPSLGKSLWYIIAGFFTGGAFLFMFLALHMERVTIISPLMSSYAVFVLLLTPLVAGKIEVITPRKVAGALLVVVGVIFLSLGRN